MAAGTMVAGVGWQAGRASLVRERARVVQRLEKVLEGANIKPGAVVTELLGVSGQAMLDAALQGVTDPEELVGLAHRKLRPRRALLVQALAGRLTRPLRFLAQQHLDHWRELDARVSAFDTEIAELLRPFDHLIGRLDAIPGVGRRTAEVIVAEIGTDVAASPSERHLAAWAGASPGNRQSGGRRKPARTSRGNPWIKAALTAAAWAAARCKHGYLAASNAPSPPSATSAMTSPSPHGQPPQLQPRRPPGDLAGPVFHERSRPPARETAVSSSVPLADLGSRARRQDTGLVC